jgi:hypothetical protein
VLRCLCCVIWHQSSSLLALAVGIMVPHRCHCCWYGCHPFGVSRGRAKSGGRYNMHGPLLIGVCRSLFPPVVILVICWHPLFVVPPCCHSCHLLAFVIHWRLSLFIGVRCSSFLVVGHLSVITTPIHPASSCSQRRCGWCAVSTVVVQNGTHYHPASRCLQLW